MIPLLIALGMLALALVGRSLPCSADRSARLASASVSVAAGVVVALVVAIGLAAPFSPWDSVRLAPAMALLRGHNPYAGAGSGAVLSTMYGPVAMAAYLPAAMVGDSALAATLGRWLAFGFAVVPLLVCCRFVDSHSDRDWRLAVAVAAMLAMVLSPALGYSTTFLHADAPALGLTGLACLLAARSAGPGLGAAVACVLAVATKQTLATLPLALLAAAWMDGGRAAAARFGATLGAVGVTAAGVIFTVFDRQSLYLNLVSVPGGVPWRGHAPWNLVATATELLIHAAPLLVVWAVIVRYSRVSSHPMTDNEATPTSADAASRRARVFLLAAVALAPMSVLGRIKEAGDVNSFSPALYPLLLAVASLASSIAPPRTERRRLTCAAGLGLLALIGAYRLTGEIRTLTKERPRDAEASYLAAHPGSVYFPWNPSVHLAVEGRPTHHLFSAWERGVAGFPVAESHLRSAMPPGCRYVAFPLKRLGPEVGFGSCVQMLERYDLLAQPAVPVRLAGLPDYECYALSR